MTYYSYKGRLLEFNDIGDLKLRFVGKSYNYESRFAVFTSQYQTIYPVQNFIKIKTPYKPTIEEKNESIRMAEGQGIDYDFLEFIEYPRKYFKKELLEQIDKNIDEDEIYEYFNIDINDEKTYLHLLDIDSIYEEYNFTEIGYVILEDRIRDNSDYDLYPTTLTNTEVFELDLLMSSIKQEKIIELFNSGFKVPDYFVYLGGETLEKIYTDIDDNKNIEWYFNYEYDMSLCEKIVEPIDEFDIREYTFENINKIKNEIEDEFFDKKDYGGLDMNILKKM